MNRDLVSIARTADGGTYPQFPYAPGEVYPELSSPPGRVRNPVFAALRLCLCRLGLDHDNYGTGHWNPLGEFIHPGETVLVKPNWVHHKNSSGGDIACVITHSSLLRAMVEYILLALRGHGRIVLGDAPIQSTDWAQLMAVTRAEEWLQLLETGGVAVEIRDFRQSVCRVDKDGQVLARHDRACASDSVRVDVDGQSELCATARQAWRFRVTNYDPGVLPLHHNESRHEYLIARPVFEADAVINMPKLKTHRKAGLTACLKNTVGINVSKEYLPHHRFGSVEEGGDEYQWPCRWKRWSATIVDALEASVGRRRIPGLVLALRICNAVSRRLARDPYREGSWYGNDTIWRTVMDLNRVLEYARADGTLAATPQRRVFNVLDGVVVGEGEGPLRPDCATAGIILAGQSAAAVDAVAARLIGLDPGRIPLLRNALTCLSREFPSCDIRLVGEHGATGLNEVEPIIRVKPPSHWAGHVELTQRIQEDRESQTSKEPA